MIAYSCNECSQCTLKCPKEFNMKGIFTALKEDYAEKNNGLVPLEILKESDRTQEKECGDEYCTRVDGSLQKKEVPEKQKQNMFCSWMYRVCILSKGSRKHCETPQRMSGT